MKFAKLGALEPKLNKFHSFPLNRTWGEEEEEKTRRMIISKEGTPNCLNFCSSQTCASSRCLRLRRNTCGREGEESEGRRREIKCGGYAAETNRPIFSSRAKLLEKRFSSGREVHKSRASSSVDCDDYPFLPKRLRRSITRLAGRFANVAVAERRDDNETAARKRWQDVWRGSPRGEGPGGSCSEAKSHNRGCRRERERREARGPAGMNEVRE